MFVVVVLVLVVISAWQSPMDFESISSWCLESCLAACVAAQTQNEALEGRGAAEP